MSTNNKLAQRTVHTSDFSGQQAQRLAQDTARKANVHSDSLSVMTNRGYAALATDTGNVAAAAYATLLTATITTVLASGFIVITWSASGIQITSSARASFQVLVDGVVVRGLYTTIPTAGFAFNVAMVVRVAVTRGAHTVALQWKTNANSIHINPVTVNEEHAHLLVQEAA